MKNRRLRILSLSTVYPTASEPALGIFVKRRLDHLAALADVRVIAPQPAIDYAKLRAAGFVPDTKKTSSGTINSEDATLRPRWWFPPGGGLLNPPLLAAQLMPTIRRMRGATGYPFDVIDAHFGYPAGVAAAFLASMTGCPFTITLRGDETMHAAFPMRDRWLKWALRRASGVFAVSNRLRDWALTCGVPADLATTIPNGVDNELFRLLPENPEPLRHQIGLTNADDRLILSVGYLIERKGHHHLIQAVHELSKKPGFQDHLHIAIAGEPGREGNFAEHLANLAQSLGLQDRVHFLGRQSPQQVAQLMNAADFLVLASTREGWPNVVQEALACGCPVIASDIGGTPDMIPDQRYGYLLPEGRIDSASLEAVLQKALSQPTWDRAAIAAWGGHRSWKQVALDVVTQLEALRLKH